jgi:hypothetical protein
VQLYLPTEDVFAARKALRERVQPGLALAGFTDQYHLGDPHPSYPLWRNIQVDDFHGETGFDLQSFEAAVVAGFRELISIEPLIDEAFQALPEKAKVPQRERTLKTVAILDTESTGAGTAR